MFNREDYINYFLELYKTEADMKHSAQSLLHEINDDYSRDALQRIIQDEQRHMKMIQEMIQFFM